MYCGMGHPSGTSGQKRQILFILERAASIIKGRGVSHYFYV